MPRVKKPVLAIFKMVGFSTKHPQPIHVVGFLKEGERYVTIGMSVDEAKTCYQKLGEALEKAAQTHEIDSIQH